MRVDAIYGAIGRFSVRFRWLILLIWMWLSAFAVLFGAEINGEAERQTRRDSSSPIGQRKA